MRQMDKGPIRQLAYLVEDLERSLRHWTQFTGVGPWTVDMLLIFSLARTDVWPVGEIAPRRFRRQAEALRPVAQRTIGGCLTS